MMQSVIFSISIFVIMGFVFGIKQLDQKSQYVYSGNMEYHSE